MFLRIAILLNTWREAMQWKQLTHSNVNVWLQCERGNSWQISDVALMTDLHHEGFKTFTGKLLHYIQKWISYALVSKYLFRGEFWGDFSSQIVIFLSVFHWQSVAM